MKKLTLFQITKYLLPLLCFAMLLCSCGEKTPAPAEPTLPAVSAEPSPSPTPSPTPSPAPTPKPTHSELYIPGLSVEDAIRYFNEVSLDAEFVNAGNASLVQRWEEPIRYILHGDFTGSDVATIGELAQWLNSIEGFPGMERTEDAFEANLSIHFCTSQEMVDILGENFSYMDGGVTFWYDDMNRIYDATICYREDMQEPLRRSVLLEEIYNGLGPVQDTSLRENSLIYSGYGEVQDLTEVDELILKLLYHPSIRSGMNADECEAVIREIYY